MSISPQAGQLTVEILSPSIQRAGHVPPPAGSFALISTLPYLKEKNSFQVFKYIFKTYGIKGYFKGLTGPLIGSSIFRAVQFATFEAFYTKAEKIELLKKKFLELFTNKKLWI